MSLDQAVDRAMRRYLALANQFRANRPAKAEFAVFRGTRAYAAVPELLELRDAVVLSGEWFVIAGDCAYCDHYVNTPLPPLSAYLIGFEADDIMLLHEPPLKLTARRAFLLGGNSNYFHWLIDCLPRLALYRGDCGALLVNGPLQTFQTQSLAQLGFADADLLPVDYPRACMIGRLFYPRTASAACMAPMTFRPATLEWLRDKFASLRSRRKAWRKLFISRARHAEAHGRRLLNEAELAAVAAEHGFASICCEDLPFDAQVTLFSEATVIAGAHGAGLTNMIFAPEGATVVEMIGPRFSQDQWGSRSYVRFSQYLRQKLVRIVGQADQGAPVHMSHLNNETYTIDPEKFRAAIRA
jgi:capsular polysaccharide biosynthesis protein